VNIDLQGLMMFMLYLVLAFLLLTNAGSFNAILNTFGTNWRQTLSTLQGR
jgi:hypothetical protein